MEQQNDARASAPPRVADMISAGPGQTAAIDCGSGIHKCMGIGSSFLVRTPAGNVLVNTGTLRDARRSKPLFDAVSTLPLRKIVLTQSHLNQFGGLEVYKHEGCEVIAHRLYPEERERYDRLDPHYRRGSRRVFRSITGSSDDLLPTRPIPPDRLIDFDDGFELGGRRFQLLWTPGGETRSSLIVWLPEERVAIVGNLMGPLFGNQPNLNTLRGDKPRSAMEFVSSVRKLRDLAPVQVLTAHEDIRGEAEVRAALTRTADSVEWIHDRTVDGMNAGVPLPQLMREISPPPELVLAEEYGKVSWNVRAIWHEYTGWYDPSRGITELYGVPASSIAPTLIDIAGSASALIEAAQRHCAAGEPLQALQLIDIVRAARPDSAAAREARREALLLLQQTTGGRNLWERKTIEAELADLDSPAAAST